MMFDLNKEREAFLNTFQYYKGRRDIIFSNEHELFMTRSNNPSEIAQEEISNINSRWDAWLRCAKHRDAELEKAKAQAVPEGYVLFPKVATKEIDEILGMQCFQFIRTAQIYRELGFEIKKRAENEQAFFLFKFLHLALVHGDKYLDVFNAETRKLIEASESGAEQ